MCVRDEAVCPSAVLLMRHVGSEERQRQRRTGQEQLGWGQLAQHRHPDDLEMKMLPELQMLHLLHESIALANMERSDLAPLDPPSSSRARPERCRQTELGQAMRQTLLHALRVLGALTSGVL